MFSLAPTRWDPFALVRGDLDGLLGSFFQGAPFGETSSVAPLNVWEEENSYVVEAAVPGFRMEDLEVALCEGQLTLSGRQSAELEVEKEGVSYRHRESVRKSFRRIVSLPENVDPDRIEAKLKDGILTIEIPKSESAKPRKIEVKLVK